jgi:hypothetical protein
MLPLGDRSCLMTRVEFEFMKTCHEVVPINRAAPVGVLSAALLTGCGPHQRRPGVSRSTCCPAHAKVISVKSTRQDVLPPRLRYWSPFDSVLRFGRIYPGRPALSRASNDSTGPRGLVKEKRVCDHRYSI